MLSLTGAKKSSSLAVIKPKTSMIPAAKISNSKKIVGSKSNNLQLINVKVLEIESMITTKLIRETTKSIKDKKKAQKEDRNEQEKDLEKGKDPGKKKIKIPKVPKLGMFGWLKRFIGSIILAFFANKMLNQLPKLVGLVKGIQTIIEFVSDIGIKLVDGLATFVDWGYKAYDATQGFLKNFGVKQEQFDQFSGALSGLIDALIIGSVILAARGEDGFGPGGLDKARRPGGRVTTGRGGQKPPRFRNPFVKSPVTRGGQPRRPGAPVSQGRGGRGSRPRFPGTGPRVTGGTPVVRTRGLPGLGGMKPSLKGGLLTAIFAGFEFSGRKGAGQTNLEAGVGTAGSTAGGLAGAKAGAVAGAALGTLIFPGVGTTIGGVIGGLLGGFGGATLGGAAADKITGAKGYQEGGKVRKKASRKLKKKKRTLNINRVGRPVYRPIPSAPQGSITNEDGKPNKAWWDFLGWAGTSDGNVQLSETGAKLGERVSQVGNTLGKNDYFGPLLSLTSKIILNKNIEGQDYDNIGLGINRLINEGILKRQISEGISGYAEGGKVASALASGIDASSWVSNTFRRDLSSDIKRKYEKIGVTGSSSGPGSKVGDRDSATGQMTPGTETGMLTALGSGGGSLKDMTEQDFSDLAYIVSHEALRGTNDEYAVAAAVLNRVADPRYPNTIMGVGTAPGQFEAVFSGKAYRDEALATQLKDNEGKIIDALKKLDGRTDFKAFSSMGQFMGDTDIMFANNGNFYHYTEQQGKGDPIPGNIPQDWKKLLGESTGEKFTPITSTSSVSASLGEGHGSEGQKIASDLGHFMKANRSKIGITGSIHQQLPDHGPKFTRNYNSLHNSNRALDIGGWGPAHKSSGGRDEQSSVIAALIEWNKKNGYDPVQLIHGSPAYKGYGTYESSPTALHSNHVHVGYEKGGMTLDGPHMAMIGEKGKEIVIDNNSSVAKVTPMLLAINAAKDERGVMKAISDYAPYEQGAQQTILVNNNNKTQPMDNYGTQDQGLTVMMANSYDNSFEFLDYQG